MANPQTADGHTKIANEIMDALMRTNFPSHERRVLDCILRKTFGWNKKTDRISYSQFEKDTGIDHRHVGRSLASLKRRGIITCIGDGYTLEYGLQKDYELWDKNDTISGTESPPSQAPNDTDKSVPALDKSVPALDKSTPSQAPNLTPSQAHTKAIKHIQKHITKATAIKQTFEEYRDSLKPKYLDFDFDHELEKFWLYWDNSDKKHTPTKPKLCLVNWMDKVRRDVKDRKDKEAQNGANQGHIKTDGSITGPRRTLGSIMREESERERTEREGNT